MKTRTGALLLSFYQEILFFYTHIHIVEQLFHLCFITTNPQLLCLTWKLFYTTAKNIHNISHGCMIMRIIKCQITAAILLHFKKSSVIQSRDTDLDINQILNLHYKNSLHSRITVVAALMAFLITG